jgi:prepilin signal peptidase PulO-like enzyme (type II secretory pathway)
MIVVHDIRTQLIPTIWILGLFIATIVFLIVYYASYGGLSLATLAPHAVGLLIAVPFLILYLFSHGRWMGFADIEIIAWMGMMLGLLRGISAVLIGFYTGAAFAIFLVIYQMIVKKKTYQVIRKQAIPFAPFLLFGWFMTLVTSFSIIDLFTKLFL